MSLAPFGLDHSVYLLGRKVADLPKHNKPLDGQSFLRVVARDFRADAVKEEQAAARRCSESMRTGK